MSLRKGGSGPLSCFLILWIALLAGPLHGSLPFRKGFEGEVPASNRIWLQTRFGGNRPSASPLLSPTPSFAPNPSSASEKRLPTAGTASSPQILRVIVVPVAFSDTNFRMTSNDIVSLFNGSAESSVSNYYAIQSEGSLAMDFTVTGAITMSGTRASYAGSAQANDSYSAFSLEAASKAQVMLTNLGTGVFSSRYDRNGDGFADVVVFYHAGEGYETSTSPGDIHSHQYSFTFLAEDKGLSAPPSWNGLAWMGRYLVVPEVMNPRAVNVTNRSVIGTVCHELGHALGLIDLYNTSDGSDTAIGDADLMSLGAYNYLPTNMESFYAPVTNSYGVVYTNSPVYGKWPAPLHSWARIAMGWIRPVDVQAGATSSRDLDAYMGGSGDRVLRIKGPRASEYWLAENRWTNVAGRSNFEKGLFGTGLLLWRVNETRLGASNSHYLAANAANTDPSNRALRIEPALPLFYSSPYWVQNQFWSASPTGFGPETSPSSAYDVTGLSSGVAIRKIGTPGARMSLEISGMSLSNLATTGGWHWPNPFRVSEGPLSISVTLPQAVASFWGLAILSQDGRAVRLIKKSVQGVVAEGRNLLFVWDGKDDTGRTVNPGLYSYRFLSPDVSLTGGRVWVAP